MNMCLVCGGSPLEDEGALEIDPDREPRGEQRGQQLS